MSRERSLAVLKKKYSLAIEVRSNKDMFARKIQSYTASLAGLEETRDTPDEAVKALEARIGKMAGRAEDLLVVRWRGTVLLVRYHADGDEWRVSRLDLGDPEQVTADWVCGNYTLTTALREYGKIFGHRPMRTLLREIAIKDVIEREYKLTDGMRIPCGLPNLGTAELAKHIEFQLRYGAAKGRGLSDDDAHSYAGRNPARSDLWSHEPREPLVLEQGSSDVQVPVPEPR